MLDINKFNNSKDTILKIETNEPKVAVNIFKINNIRVVDVKKDSVSIASDKEKIGQIVEMLNNNNIKITSIFEDKKSLEDTFLDLVQENNIM